MWYISTTLYKNLSGICSSSSIFFFFNSLSFMVNFHLGNFWGAAKRKTFFYNFLLWKFSLMLLAKEIVAVSHYSSVLLVMLHLEPTNESIRPNLLLNTFSIEHTTCAWSMSFKCFVILVLSKLSQIQNIGPPLTVSISVPTAQGLPL